MAKEIFMYDHKTASKSSLLMKETNPIKPFLILLIIICISFFVFLFSFVWLPDFITDFWGNICVPFSIFLWEVLVVTCFVLYIKWIKTVYWAEQIAFIRNENTFYAMKLVYVSTGNPMEIKKSENQMAEFKRNPIIYEEILDEILWRLNIKDRRYKKPVFVRDLDKNFKLAVNGRASIIRLDNAGIFKTTDKYLYISYKDYKGKKTVLKVVQAYPNLEKTINSTVVRQYDDRFPGKVKVDYSSMIVFGVVMAVVFSGFILILFSGL